jgi:hypothetical protein
MTITIHEVKESVERLMDGMEPNGDIIVMCHAEDAEGKHYVVGCCYLY